MADSPMLVALKVEYKGELHRVRVDLHAFSFQQLTALFASTFSLAPGAFVIQYKDADGDVVNVTSEPELAEACRAFVATKDATAAALRFSAVSRTQVAFQENVAEPILKAIEKLVETLKVTMDKVKQEQWAQRAQAGVEHTGEAIKTGVQHTGVALKAGVEHTSESLKTGVEHTNDALALAAAEARVSLEQASELLSQAAEEARKSLHVAGRTIQELPLEQMIKDTGDHLKVAAATIGDFANDLVEEIRKHSVQVTGHPVAPAPAAQPAPEVVQPTPAEPEWEQVDQTPAAVEEESVVAEEEPPVVVSPEELKWAAHIAMVRDVFPDVAVAQIIDRLEQCNGNVEVVVNALMEDM